MTIEIRAVAAADVYPLRLKVLRPNHTLADCVWAHDEEESTAHFAARDGQRVVGIATVFPDPRPCDPPNTWRLRGMATAPEYRGQGIGTEMLAACCAHVRKEGGVRVWCNARTTALGFYERHGFAVVGDEFDTEVGPHYVMVTDLT